MKTLFRNTSAKLLSYVICYTVMMVINMRIIIKQVIPTAIIIFAQANA